MEVAVKDADAVPTPPSDPFRGRELLRRLCHVGVGGLAYLVPTLGWKLSCALACVAAVANRWLLSRLPGLKLVRDVARGDRGIVVYPLVVAALLVVFRDRLWVAQAGWLALAFGDGLAPFLARAIGGPRWPWRPDKRIGVSLAAGLCAAAAILPVAPHPAAALVAGLAGALADGLPAHVEDNAAWAVLGAAGARLCA
jgi:dolichol kinase